VNTYSDLMQLSCTLVHVHESACESAEGKHAPDRGKQDHLLISGCGVPAP